MAGPIVELIGDFVQLMLDFGIAVGVDAVIPARPSSANHRGRASFALVARHRQGGLAMNEIRSSHVMPRRLFKVCSMIRLAHPSIAMYTTVMTCIVQASAVWEYAVLSGAGSGWPNLEEANP